MAMFKKFFVCADCQLKTSTTDPKRAELRVCRNCKPEIETAAPAKATPKAAKPAPKSAKTTTKPAPAKADRPAKSAAAKADKASPKATTPAKTKAVAVTAKADAGEKKMAGLTAAALVLKETGEELNAKAVLRAIQERGLWTSKGLTPDQTLYAAMYREIRDKGKESRFAWGKEKGTFRATSVA